MKRTALFLFTAVLAAAGCGDKKTTPTTPTPAPVTGITVSGPDTVLLGSTATFTAAVTGGSGGACAWGQDAPAVGTVSNGTFTSVGNGAVTIWCELAGVRGTKRIVVIPNFGGRWTGAYAITGCAATGFFSSASTCDDFRNGQAYPFTAVLTQTGTTVTGSFSLGTITASQQSGAIVGDGFSMLLTHEGTGSIRLTSTWNVRQSQPNQMVGSVRQDWSTTTLAGTMVVTGDIATATRSTTTAVTDVAPSRPAPSLADLISALR